ncbi:MAG: tetratricopeptide repeat protein [Pseudomonadota bacterium]
MLRQRRAVTILSQTADRRDKTALVGHSFGVQEGYALSFISELKRRQVYRAGITYLVGAWLLLQIVDVLGDNLDLPSWLFRGLLAIIVIGFPLVLILSWVFERTPKGIQVDQGATESEAGSPQWQYLQLGIIVALTGVVGVLVYERFQLADDAQVVLERSVAVLPFSNRSAELEDAYFVDGMHDDIVTELAGLQSLQRVISQTTIERYRQTQLSLSEIATELDVATVLEGSVQRAGDRVRINMKLYDAERDRALWTETWDRELTIDNLFSIQNQITREVVTALNGALTDSERSAIERQPTDNLEAFELYAQARQEVAKRTAASLETAIDLFERAIAIDPQYADAYVGIANALSLQPGYAGIAQSETFERRDAAIRKALNLDPNSARAYAALGMLADDRGESDTAEQHFKRSLQLNPNESTALHWYAVHLNSRDRFDEALRLIERARDSDPLGPILVAAEASIYESQKKSADTQRILLEAIKRTPEFHVFYDLMATSFYRAGDLAEALRWADRAVQMEPTSPDGRIAQCQFQLELDMPDRGEACVAQLSEDFPARVPEGRSDLHFTLMSLRGDLTDFLVPVGFAIDLPRGPRTGIAAAYILNGEPEPARTLLESLEPRLYEGELPAIGPSQLDVAMLSSVALARVGDLARSQEVFEATVNGIELREDTYFMSTLVLLALERFDDAAQSLLQAIAAGDIDRWWLLRSPVFRTEIDSPDWNSALVALDNEISRQREDYLARPELGPL